MGQWFDFYTNVGRSYALIIGVSYLAKFLQGA